MSIRLIRLLAILLAFTATVSCSRAPDLIGIDNPETPALSVQTASRQKVFIATTREATDVSGVFFSEERAPDLGFASVVVSIPPNHKPGQLERAKRLPPDPTREFAVIEPTVYDSDRVFVSHLRKELARRAPQDREVLFFIHGYNNTISDSILRLAQFVEDTDFNGVPVLFSWASAARVTRYVYDLNSALIARPRMLEAARVIGQAHAKGYNIFAHSMGSFLLMEGIVQNQLRTGGRTDLNVLNVMMAAPDIDMDLFRTQLEYLRSEQRNFYVFVSRDDKALRFSQRISGGVERVGRADVAELQELGLTVIDLSQVDDSSSGTHSKFAGSPEIVQLIGSSLQSDNFNRPSSAPTLVEVLGGVPVLRVVVE